MQLLERRILTDGEVLPGGILKVDGFLNHQMDPQLLTAMGEEFHRLFAGMGVNKILTIEASGIGPACFAGLAFGCPVLFAKKNRTATSPASSGQAGVLLHAPCGEHHPRLQEVSRAAETAC